MTHWLDDKINEQNSTIGKDISISKDGLQSNVDANQEKIAFFMDQISFLFDKLKTVMDNDFNFSFVKESPNNVIDCERTRLDAINATQPTAFLRRVDMILCDAPGELVLEFYRAKRENDSDPWKFHDEQHVPCQMSELTEEIIYEIIDWFAWKNYFPRGIRK